VAGNHALVRNNGLRCLRYVTIAADAITDPPPEGHRHSLDRVFPALGQAGTTAEIIALLPVPEDARQA
jgi:hypothetical protein